MFTSQRSPILALLCSSKEPRLLKGKSIFLTDRDAYQIHFVLEMGRRLEGE